METNALWPLRRWQCTLQMFVPFVAVIFLFSFVVAAEGKVIRIDTHSHYVPPFLYDVCISKGLNAGGMRIPKWNVEDHLEFMDSHNIEMSILSVSTPGARLTPFESVEDGRKLARDLNEYGHMLATIYPERFQFFATLTLPDVEGSVAEAIYALDTLKAAGVILLANAQAVYLGNPNFDPLMEALDARGAIVFVHPNTFDLAPVTNAVGDKNVTLPSYMVDFMLDTTRAAVNLLRMKVLERYPNIRFILAHGGGFLPFAAYRVASTTSYQTGEPTEKVLQEIKKFYVETAISASSSSLASVLDIIPRHHIMYGSDYPYPPPHLIEECVQVYEQLPLEDKTRHEIDFLAANGLFEKPLKYWRSVWHQTMYSGLEGPQTV